MTIPNKNGTYSHLFFAFAVQWICTPGSSRAYEVKLHWVWVCSLTLSQ
jgi:hypothetical protein